MAVAPLPVLALLSFVQSPVIAILSTALFQIPAIGLVLALVPLMPVVPLSIVISFVAIAIAVAVPLTLIVVVGADCHRRTQSYSKQKQTYESAHSLSPRLGSATGPPFDAGNRYRAHTPDRHVRASSKTVN